MPAALSARLRDAVIALVGQNAYQPPPMVGNPTLDDEQVERMRPMYGGNLQPPTVTKTEWFLSDVSDASRHADAGDLRMIAQLWKASKADGIIGGLRSTRTAGLVALPKTFRGLEAAVQALKPDNESRCLFDEMFPPAELAALADDALGLGIAVGEMCPASNRPHPVLRRLDPEFLVYRWNEGRFYYRAVVGMIPIKPGDGRWLLHIAGPALSPWHGGVWRAIGRAYVIKEHALLHRGNFSGKLANPARVAFSAQGSTEQQRAGFLARLIAWGVNTVFELPAGWEVKLLESNGRGWEVFGKEIETSDLEAMIALAGQVVTVTGGTGFANADIHDVIRADLIQKTADELAHTINTQGIPPWQAKTFGVETVIESPVRMAWNTARPAERTTEATGLKGAGDAITTLTAALAAHDIAVDARELATRFGVPTTEDPKALVRAKAVGAVAPTAPQAPAPRPNPGVAWGSLPTIAASIRNEDDDDSAE